MKKLLSRLWKDEEGAAAAEYALILGLAALAIIVGATALGTEVNNKYQAGADAVKAAGAGTAG
jgi:pilus assembly protein Flp/PilA